ncbi:MaoC family dehydratase [Nocardia sp. NBC_01388]|uniref:MaoC family dehydratase n=1 Tax=Nocardia sp. NBC_01388 TaxID=2903596 RepID=UPI00386A2726
MTDLTIPPPPDSSVTVYRGIDELEAAIGQELGPTEWFTMTQSRIDGFADGTEDHQWIHVDPTRAADSPYGATVAHGFLTLSLVPYFVNRLRRIDGVRMGVNYGLEKVRFPTPVRAGSRIRARTTMVQFDRLDEKSIQLTTRTAIEVEGEPKPACVADLVSRYYLA